MYGSVLAELKSRFADFQESGDDSRIPSDLQRTIYTTVRIETTV